MKKVLSLCLVFFLLCGIPIRAFALDGDTSDAATESIPSTQPSHIRTEMVGEVPYITMIYQLDDPDVQLVEEILSHPDFEENGYTFSLHDYEQQVEPNTLETREESKTISVVVEGMDNALVVAKAAPFMEFDRDGFAGRLYLDEDSIQFEEIDQSADTYRMEDTVVYNDLNRQDTAAIPQTIETKGGELNLVNVEWVTVEQPQTDAGPAPATYKAIATYRDTSQTATVRYIGVVEKEVPGSCTISLKFRSVQTTVEVPAPESSAPYITVVVLVFAGFAVLVLGGLAFFTRSKKRRQGSPDDQSESAEANQTPDEQDTEPESPLEEPIPDDLLGGYEENVREQETAPETLLPDLSALFSDEMDIASETGQGDDGEYAGEGYFYGQPADDADEI